MNVAEIRQQLKSMGSFQLEKDLFRYVKIELVHVIKSYNMEQIFQDSEDIYGNPLGTYSVDHYQAGKRIGDPFDMVDSGAFRRGFKVEVLYRKIKITSTTPHLKDMLSNSDGRFDSTHFFGLNDDNYNEFVKEFINPFVIRWYRQKLNL